MRTVTLIGLKNPENSIVRVIKQIRELTGLGLKEAKIIADGLKVGIEDTITIVSEDSDTKVVRFLNNSDMIYQDFEGNKETAFNNTPKENLKIAAQQLFDQEDYEKAIEVMKVLNLFNN